MSAAKTTKKPKYPLNKEIPVAFFLADMSKHTAFVDTYKRPFLPTRKAFKTNYLDPRVKRRKGAELSYAGDGGMFVFWDDGAARRAVLAALASVSDMYLFNLEHSPFPDVIDAKFGVHWGLAVTNIDPGHWGGDTINRTGHFFGDGLKSGVLRISQVVYDQLDSKMKGYFHKTKRYRNYFDVYEFDRRHTYEGSFAQAHLRSSIEILDILNKQGDVFITHNREVQNLSANIELKFINANIGCDTSAMTWDECDPKAWRVSGPKRRKGRKLVVNPRDDHPHLKSWSIEFPSLKPTDPPIEIGSSCRWNKMFPKSDEFWKSYASSPTDNLETRILFPKSLKPRVGSVEVLDITNANDHKIVKDAAEIITPAESESGRWEIHRTQTTIKENHTYKLEWSVERT